MYSMAQESLVVAMPNEFHSKSSNDDSLMKTFRSIMVAPDARSNVLSFIDDAFGSLMKQLPLPRPGDASPNGVNVSTKVSRDVS